MKVFEVLMSNVEPISEELLKERLRTFNWKYEFSNDDNVVRAGEKELELLENMLYKLWKEKPTRALQLWEETSPWAVNGTVPTFIFHLQSQE